MHRIACLMAVLLAMSCTGDVTKVKNNASTNTPSASLAFDANSSFGDIEIFEERLVFQSTVSEAERLSLMVKKQIRKIPSKQFFLIDIEAKRKEDASKFGKMVQSILNQQRVNFEIKIGAGSDKPKSQTISVLLRSAWIKPKDCSHNVSPILERVGSYHEAKFGCSYANNIAAMLDNPRDAIAPRKAEALSTIRTMQILRAYVEGKATGAALPESEAGEASAVSSSE